MAQRPILDETTVALTFDDVLLAPRPSDVLPGEARVLEAAQEALAGRRRGARGALPFLGPAFIAAAERILRAKIDVEKFAPSE